MERIIEQTEDGSTTLFVPELNEHYHSVKGARTESQHIFIDMGLKASAATLPHILEIGFGTGLNALLTLETAGLEQRPVHYTGIELYPLSWEEVDVLHYSDNPLFKELHTAPWHKDVNITPYFTLHKIQGDVNKVMSDKQSAMSDRLPVHHSSLTTNHYFDLVYFDAFAPEKQPEMWSEELFRHIYAAMNNNGILTTYCAKGVIRRLLQAIGFRVERLPGPPGGKREILRASKTKECERSTVVIETPEGVEVLTRQIAGAVARRIVTYAEVGEECYIDEHMGFIKFGSRVDVYLPLGTEVCVNMGQLTTGNQTVIAKLK